MLVQSLIVQAEASSATPGHSYGPDCRHCGDGRPGTQCDLRGYSPREVRFVRAHLEAYRSAYLNPNRGAAHNELERLEREYKTLPPRHQCSCYPTHCAECLRLGRQRVQNDVAVEIGRTSRVTAPMPAARMLDLARAIDVVPDTNDSVTIARYMSLDGLAGLPEKAPEARPRQRHQVEFDYACILCGRAASAGVTACQTCGGSIMAEEAIDAA